MLYPLTSAACSTTPNFNRSFRKQYIVKNVQKSFSLAVLLAYAMFTIMTTPEWDNANVRLVATAYVSNDIVGLLTCRLPLSTMMHHVVACSFLFFSYFVDFASNVEAQMIFYYTLFSAATFYVNLYLGLRHCYSSLPRLHRVSRYGYAATLLVNWSFQVWKGWGRVHVWYIILLCFIIYDDIVLLRWLWRRHDQHRTKAES